MATPNISNVTLTSADTEYSLTLKPNCKFVSIQARTAAAIRFSFETDKVATPTAPYATIKSGGGFSTPEHMNLRGGVLYLASSSAGTVVEVVEYS